MEAIIQYLNNNDDVISKVKEGTLSLLDVSAEELKAILEVFFEEENTQKAYYWK